MQKVIIGLAPNVTVEVASDNVKQLVEQASFWNSLPHVCPICQAPVVFFHRLTREDDSYWGQACTGSPIHEANFGVYKKEERGFYYKGDWQKAYDAYQNSSGGRGDDFTGQQTTNGNPIGKSLGDMVTAKQLWMIRTIAQEANIDADRECSALMHCSVDELSKRAASGLIEYLQGLQKNPSTASLPKEPTPVVLPQNTAPNPSATRPAPVGSEQHGAQCRCSSCEIPF